MIFVAPDLASHETIVRQLIRIGYDRLNGYLSGGLEAWQSAGLPLEMSQRLELPALRDQVAHGQGPLVLDVRQHNEFRAGHIQGSLNIELGKLSAHLDGLPRDLPIVTVCASGMRSSIAGSILQRDGRSNIQVVDEMGAPEWISRGYPSATGDEYPLVQRPPPPVLGGRPWPAPGGPHRLSVGQLVQGNAPHAGQKSAHMGKESHVHLARKPQ
ncbi:MAG: rhodanese-like domain-containing protein [SAR202 cluster bacterium]|nr:rhodanese-like domain-containing protein [SAR202 cluster bacterium]